MLVDAIKEFNLMQMRSKAMAEGQTGVREHTLGKLYLIIIATCLLGFTKLLHDFGCHLVVLQKVIGDGITDP